VLRLATEKLQHFFSKAPHHEDEWGRGDTKTHILNLGFENSNMVQLAARGPPALVIGPAKFLVNLLLVRPVISSFIVSTP
jgi:hypothetical protein